MAGEHLRSRLSRQLDEWDYDFRQFDISTFIDWVQARRGRSIRLVPMTLPPELFGAWLEGERTDYIFYEAEPLHVHSVHIILHELCHILLGHKTANVWRDMTQLLQPGDAIGQLAAQKALNGLFRQASHTDEQETEAETLSSLIQYRVYQQAGIAALSHTGQGLAMREFMQALGMDGAE